MTVQISEEMLEHVAQPGNVPSVSVVVPSYRSGRFLREALASVQSQTLEDWEIIIVCIGVVVAFGQTGIALISEGILEGSPESGSETYRVAIPSSASYIHESRRAERFSRSCRSPPANENLDLEDTVLATPWT